MSLLTDFTTAASSAAFGVIGAESLTIGSGAAVDAVFDETVSSKDFGEFGNDTDNALVAVVRRAAWDVAYPLAGLEYVNQKATARGITFRVKRVRIGAGFAEIMLETVTKA